MYYRTMSYQKNFLIDSASDKFLPGWFQCHFVRSLITLNLHGQQHHSRDFIEQIDHRIPMQASDFIWFASLSSFDLRQNCNIIIKRMFACRRWLHQNFIDLADIINDIIIDSLGVFRTDTYLNEAVENLKRLPAAIGAVLNIFAFFAVKRRPIRMPRPLVNHRFCDRQQNRAGHR